MKAITKFNKKVEKLRQNGEESIVFFIKGKAKVFAFYSGLLDEKRKELMAAPGPKTLYHTHYTENLVNPFYFKGFHIGANYQGDRNWCSYPEDYTFAIILTNFNKTTNK